MIHEKWLIEKTVRIDKENGFPLFWVFAKNFPLIIDLLSRYLELLSRTTTFTLDGKGDFFQFFDWR